MIDTNQNMSATKDISNRQEEGSFVPLEIYQTKERPAFKCLSELVTSKYTDFNGVQVQGKEFKYFPRLIDKATHVAD